MIAAALVIAAIAFVIGLTQWDEIKMIMRRIEWEQKYGKKLDRGLQHREEDEQ